MKTAPPLPKEKARESALKSLRLLDTPPEERFDRVTRLAQRMFDVQMASISLLDTSREWHKSAIGLTTREFPREHSFLNYALHFDDVTIVEDTLGDPRFEDSPLTRTDPKLRFYAVAPIAIKAGIKVGALNLMDRSPREFNDADRALLRDLAKIVEHELTSNGRDNMDALTMLSNRDGFEELCQHALNICRRFERPATLLFLNIEDLSGINQQFGRAEGDFALKNFGRMLIQTFRASDVVGRVGGDDFVVLMSDTSAENSARALSRLDAALSEYNLAARRGYILSYNVGSVQYQPEVHPSITGLLGAADMMMADIRRRKRKEAR